MPSRALADCEPSLAEKAQLLIERYNALHPGMKWLLITCTYRSPAEQRALFAQGRTAPGKWVTDKDGYIKRSAHNERPARAVDFAIVEDPDGPAGPLKAEIEWADVAAYKEMGLIAEGLGLVWGGRWRKVDCAHVELPDRPVPAPGSDE